MLPTDPFTLSLHDALPISSPGCHTGRLYRAARRCPPARRRWKSHCSCHARQKLTDPHRSEEHTSELQSRENLVCRLLLEKKKSSTTLTIRSWLFCSTPTIY